MQISKKIFPKHNSTRAPIAASILPKAAALLLALATGAGCSAEAEDAYFCDSWKEGECQARWEASGGEPVNRYRVELASGRGETWRDLGHFLYFYSRATPGLRVEFNRWLTESETEGMAAFQCSYRFTARGRSVEGELEGVRVDSDRGGVWCFDYLGAMLGKWHKEAGTEEEPPTPDFFPVELEIRLHAARSELEAQRTGFIMLEWTPSP